MSKVSYVAAVREVSIVLSSYFGVVYWGRNTGGRNCSAPC